MASSERSTQLPILPVIGFAAVLELALQSMRALFPLGYHLVGSLGFIITPLVLLPVFLTPVLTPLVAPLLQRATGGRAVPALILGLVAARCALQAWPVLPVAILATAIWLVTLTAALGSLADHPADAIAAGSLVGFALDIGLRAWRVSDDVVWSQSWTSFLDPSLVIPVAAALVCAGSLGAGSLGTGSLGTGSLGAGSLGASERRRPAPTFSWFVLLMPMMLLFASPAFAASSSGLGFGVSAAALLVACAASMALLAWPASRRLGIPAAAAMLAAAFGMPRMQGPAVLAPACLALLAYPLVLRALVRRHHGRVVSPWREGLAAAAGAVTMFALLLLHPMHYELPLPISNAWLPAIAVVVGCLALLRPMDPAGADPEPFASPSAAHWPGVIGTAAAGLVVAGAVSAGIVGGSVTPGPATSLKAGEPSSGVLRVATYNTGQGQSSSSGGLAYREMAEEIVSLDADIVALQEVARGWPLTSMGDFLAWLEANTDFTLFYYPAADLQFGNAVLSRVPLVHVEGVELEQGDGAQDRSAIRAELADGTLVYAMHLQARNTPEAELARLNEMEQILDHWGGAPRTILVGDLNARNEYADATRTPPKQITNLEPFLEAGFATSQPTELCTLPTSNDNCSDYVMITADLRLAKPNEVIQKAVSDHRPVLAAVIR